MSDTLWEKKTTQMAITNILEKTEKLENSLRNGITTIDFTALLAFLSEEESIIVRAVLKINPAKYGFRGTYLGIQSLPENLVPIRNQAYTLRGK